LPFRGVAKARVADGRRRRPDHHRFQESSMLRWAALFAVIAAVAGFVGFTGIEAGLAEIAKTLFYILVGLAVVFLALGLTVFKQ
jgi:uncharacterized membrane protein YtjA (UPF0391 family)